jgi:UDP-2-acetamido-2,6-beta-L-arabino-hexul-4-ose reductase
MTNILVTGAKGFVGKNLGVALRRQVNAVLNEYDLGNSPEELRQALVTADVIFHLAGVNRPEDVTEYQTGNAGFTVELCSALRSLQRAPKIVFASSIQAELDNPYGASKRAAEATLQEFATASGAECVVYRFKNLFGKWCRPNYNSVIATFCYNIAHDLPNSVSDASREMELTYIDDVVNAFLAEILPTVPGFRYVEPLVSYQVTLGELVEIITAFRQMRSSLQLPDFSKPFTRALYATYLSYLNQTDFGYQLAIKEDQRGSLSEFIKAPQIGQIFVSRTYPGITRGNHYHHTKIEKFLVLQGEAVIRLRNILETEVIECRVRGEDYRVVDIPPGYTHSIQNVGKEDLVTLFWADEVFDPNQHDTYYEDV